MTMRIRLPDRWTRFLQSQPEHGMGYQRVRIRLRGGRSVGPAMVFNAEELEVSAEALPLDPQDIVEVPLDS